jgi:hypothetical protein
MAAAAFAVGIAAALGFGATQALASPAQGRACGPTGTCSGTLSGLNVDPSGCGAVCAALYPESGGEHHCTGGRCCLCVLAA